MSKLSAFQRVAGPLIVAGGALLGGCTATLQAVQQDASAIGTKIRQTVAPTTEEAAAKAQRDAAEQAARAAAARDPNSYVAPSLNLGLAREIHRQLQLNPRLNPQKQLMAFNSVPFERQLRAGVSSASNPVTNLNNPNSAPNQLKGRANNAIIGAIPGNTIIGQMGRAAAQGAMTAEAASSQVLATTGGLLVQANNLANAGRTADAYKLVNGILNAGSNVGLVGVPGEKPVNATASGITWQGVQDALGIGSEEVVRKVLPSTGPGGVVGDVIDRGVRKLTPR